MNYIFCPSYASVFFALHLKSSGKEIKIITNNISVKKYCRSADIECIYFDYIDISITRFYKIFIFKSRIKNLIKKINIKKEDNFYLLDNTFCYNGFYLAKEWSKKGNVYFIYNLVKFPKNYIKDKYLNLNFLEKTTLIYLFKIFLGLDLILFEVNCRPIFGFDDKFLERNEIKKNTLNRDLRELQLDAMRKSHIKQKEYDNLIITEGSVSGILNENSVQKMYKNLLKLPYKFAVKHHPRVLKTQKSERYEKLFINCEEFPDYIPVELLFNNVRKNVISLFSTSLIAASQLEHIKAISLLELVEWNNPAYKKEVKKWLLKESNKRIIFVNNFEELNTFLEG
jgi:hypothetical protein